jgi:hypothetical protein
MRYARLVNPHPVDSHRDCPPWVDREVTCDRCMRSYTCAPGDDHYCDARSNQHLCEDCLLGGLSLQVVMVTDIPRLPSAADDYRPRHDADRDVDRNE